MNMNDYRIFDANCRIGRHMRLTAEAPHTLRLAIGRGTTLT